MQISLSDSDAGVYSVGDPAVIWYYTESVIPDNGAHKNAARVSELRPTEDIETSEAYRFLYDVFSKAQTLTSVAVRRALVCSYSPHSIVCL